MEWGWWTVCDGSMRNYSVPSHHGSWPPTDIMLAALGETMEQYHVGVRNNDGEGRMC